MKYVGIVYDMHICDFVVEHYIPSNITYVRFPFFHETEYQKTRFYPDDVPLTLEHLNELRKGNHK